MIPKSGNRFSDKIMRKEKPHDRAHQRLRAEMGRPRHQARRGSRAAHRARPLHRRSSRSPLGALRAQPGGRRADRGDRRAGGRDRHHRRRSRGREDDHADAAQVQLQAGRPAGAGRRRSALRRRAGRRRRGRERGRGRGHRRPGRTCHRRDHAGDRCARGACARRAAGACRGARQRHPRRPIQDPPTSMRSGAARQKSSNSTRARTGRTRRRWRRAPATPPSMRRPAA